METIYYDVNSDQAFRDDKTDIANDNKPEFVYKTERQFILQFLNSTSKDANDDYNDPYTGFAGITITPSGAIDNNFDHVFPGKLNAGISGTISEFQVKEVTGGTPRIAGTVKVTNGAGDYENINYNTFTLASGVYTFKTADANFDINPVALTNTYLADDSAIVKELPIIKIQPSDIDQTDKDTGKFIITVDSYQLIFQDLIEGSEEIANTQFEFQATNTIPRIELAKRFDVILSALMDDDGNVGPAPRQDYYTIAETESAIARAIGVRKRAVINIVDPTSAPPTEIEGDRYILDETAGVVDPGWDGAVQNDIVEFDGSEWQANTPEEGWIAYVDAEDKDALFVDDGTPAWELRPALDTKVDKDLFNLIPSVSATIGTGSVALPKAIQTILPESGTADELVTITGMNDGELRVVRAENPAHIITLKHGTGNLVLPDDSDFNLTGNTEIILHRDGANIRMIGGAGGAGGGGITEISITDSTDLSGNIYDGLLIVNVLGTLSNPTIVTLPNVANCYKVIVVKWGGSNPVRIQGNYPINNQTYFELNNQYEGTTIISKRTNRYATPIPILANF